MIGNILGGHTVTSLAQKVKVQNGFLKYNSTDIKERHNLRKR